MSRSNSNNGGTSLSRRKVLAAGIALWGGGLFGLGLPAYAKPQTTEAFSSFMQLSQLLVNHHLDKGVGLRMWALLKKQYPQLDEQVAAILDVAKKQNARIVEDFFPQIPEGELTALAHKIIFGWYAGCLEPSKTAESFAFAEALTFQNTADVIAIPSYGLTGPNKWADRENVQILPLRQY